MPAPHILQSCIALTGAAEPCRFSACLPARTIVRRFGHRCDDEVREVLETRPNITCTGGGAEALFHHCQARDDLDGWQLLRPGSRPSNGVVVRPLPVSPTHAQLGRRYARHSQRLFLSKRVYLRFDQLRESPWASLIRNESRHCLRASSAQVVDDEASAASPRSAAR